MSNKLLKKTLLQLVSHVYATFSKYLFKLSEFSLHTFAFVCEFLDLIFELAFISATHK